MSRWRCVISSRRAARRPKSVDDLVAEEPAVAAAAVEDAVGIEPHAVGRELAGTFDERAQRRIRAAVRRQAHQLDLAFVRVPAEVLRHRAVEPSERVRQSQVTHRTQRAIRCRDRWRPCAPRRGRRIPARPPRSAPSNRTPWRRDRGGADRSGAGGMGSRTNPPSRSARISPSCRFHGCRCRSVCRPASAADPIDGRPVRCRLASLAADRVVVRRLRHERARHRQRHAQPVHVGVPAERQRVDIAKRQSALAETPGHRLGGKQAARLLHPGESLLLRETPPAVRRATDTRPGEAGPWLRAHRAHSIETPIMKRRVITLPERRQVASTRVTGHGPVRPGIACLSPEEQATIARSK